MEWLNLPNKLTLIRILVVPFILVLSVQETKWTCLFAAILFTIAAITDFIDGYLARRSNIVTSLGKFLDPLADKVLVCSILIILVQLGWIPGWIAIVIICRDIMVTGLRAIAADEGVVIAADKFGKIKTILQLIALGPLLVHYNWFGIPVKEIGEFLLYLALFLTVFSGYNYFLTFFRDVRSKEKQ